MSHILLSAESRVFMDAFPAVPQSRLDLAHKNKEYTLSLFQNESTVR
jgi:hypothetical protein